MFSPNQAPNRQLSIHTQKERQNPKWCHLDSQSSFTLESFSLLDKPETECNFQTHSDVSANNL